MSPLKKLPPSTYIVLAIFFLGILQFSHSKKASEEIYNWTFQTSASAGDDFFRIENEWTQHLNKLSNGKINIRLLPAGSVVQYNETLEAVGAGIIQGQVTDPSYFSGKDPAFAMLGNLVGAWSAPEEMLDFMENGGGKTVFNELVNPYGLQFIGASATGLEAFLSKKPLNGVDDLKGLKLRAPEGMVQEVFAAAGASPANLPGSEVYTSLEKGVIEAADYTVFSTNHSLGMHRFANYPVYPGFHSMPLVEVSMNKKLWDSLPQDIQALINESVKTMASDMIGELKQKDIVAVKLAEADPNINVINWSAEERARFRTIAQTQWKNWSNRSPMAQKVFDTVSVYLAENNLLAN